MKADGQKGNGATQIFAIFTVSLCSITSGLLFTWPTQAIPMLVNDPTNDITLEEASYFAVLPSVGMILAAPLFAYLTDRIGRKKTMIFSTLPQFLSWMLTAYGGSVYVYFAARLLSGCVDAGYYTTVPVYIAETATPKIRGTWGNGMTLMYYSGNFLLIVAVEYLLIRKSAYVLSSIPVLYFLLLLVIPETPYFLLMKGNKEAALKSLQWLRRSNDVQEEFEQINVDVKRQLSETGTVKDMFLIKSNRRALIVGTFLRAAQQFAGISAIAIYAQIIFAHGIQGLSSTTSTMIFNGLLVITNFGAATVLDKIGRRLSMIISLLGCAVLLSIQAIYFYLEIETEIDLTSFNLVPAVGLFLYVLFYAVGIGIMPALMLGELFSSSVKGKSLCCMNIVFAILIAGCTKLFQLLMTNFGMYVAFGFFAVTSFVSTVMSCYIMPETSGKTLEEIQQSFKKN